MSTIVPLFRPPLRPSRLAPLAEAFLKWTIRDAVADAVRGASVRLAEAALAARRRGLKGRP